MIINSSNVIRKFPPLATGLIILLIISSMLLIYLASLVQFSCSVMSNSLQPHWLQHARPPCPSPNPGVTQTHVHWVSDAIQPSHLLSSPSPTFNLSSIKVFSNEWVLHHQVAKVLEFQLQHQSFQSIFRTDFLYDGQVWSHCCPRDSKSLLQHHSSKASILWCSAFFIVQLSHSYMTTGKNSFD